MSLQFTKIITFILLDSMILSINLMYLFKFFEHEVQLIFIFYSNKQFLYIRSFQISF